MYSLIRSLLFRIDPELAHSIIIHTIGLVGRIPFIPAILRHLYYAEDNPVQAFGLNFTNPIGLAAGYDKDALGWRGLTCLGFGHIEIGTVTLKPQSGNPKPRIFRLPAQQAVINRMGFPGVGAEVVARRISSKRSNRVVLGVNIGKNKDTPLESAAQDYLELIKIFSPFRWSEYVLPRFQALNAPVQGRTIRMHVNLHSWVAVDLRRQGTAAPAVCG